MRFSSRRVQPRTRVLAFLLLAFLFIIILLPYDSTLVLLVRWHLNTLSSVFSPRGDNYLLHTTRPRFPLDIAEVGIIIKTGFSTQERLLARLDAFEPARNPSNLVLVGDYSTTQFKHNGLQLPVHNALAGIVDSGALLARPKAVRVQYYWNMTRAIANRDFELAKGIGRMHGWELDIMKHVSGLEIGYRTMPHKKWYILADDDTYLLNHSLELILQHLDPSIPHYIGNAVGDYKARFAHGGSAVVLSQAAMRRIFVDNPRIVAAAHLESLESQWGDKLIATTAMKTGIYLDERYDRHFNGEAPRLTRIRADRFCVPIVSFHKMSATEMTRVAARFRDIATAVSWLDVWRIYNAPAFEAFLANPIRAEWDHVGRLDEETMTTTHVNSDKACLDLCHKYGMTCLAWTWDAEKLLCHISPWMVVGESVSGLSSGINARRAMRLAGKCV